MSKAEEKKSYPCKVPGCDYSSPTKQGLGDLAGGLMLQESSHAD